MDFLCLPEGRVSDDLVRHQAYPRSRLISYRIAPRHPTTTGRVPLREVSTIATQGAGLVYCYLSSDKPNGLSIFCQR